MDYMYRESTNRSYSDGYKRYSCQGNKYHGRSYGCKKYEEDNNYKHYGKTYDKEYDYELKCCYLTGKDDYNKYGKYRKCCHKGR